MQSVNMEGDDMLARFTDDSTSGMVSRASGSVLMLDAAASVDPSDPSNALQAMRCVSWHACQGCELHECLSMQTAE